jgi:hydrophobe/amphiphile efflux-3 (HAE3) family protein
VGRVIDFITRHPWPVLVLMLVLTGLAARQIYDPVSGEFGISFDPSANRLLPEGDAGKEFYDFTRRVFGNDESMMIVVRRENIFDYEGLSLVKRLTERLPSIDGVRVATSIANTPDIRGSDSSLQVAPLFDEVPEDPAELLEVRERALSNPVFRGNLVSTDGRSAIIQVQFLDFSDSEFVERGIDSAVQRMVDEEAGDAQTWITGAPRIKVAQIRTQIRELGRFIPVIFGVLALVLVASFRTVGGVLLPLVTIAIALTWTMGIAASIGRPLNLITILVPPLLIILGLSYAVHVVSEFYDEVRGEPGMSAARAMATSLRKTWLPVALTGMTTGAGFLALALSPMRATHEFGLLSLIGVATAVIASLSVTPAALVIFGRPRSMQKASRLDTSPSARFSRWAGELALERRELIFGVWAIAFVIALLASSRLHVASDSIQSFAPDVPVRMDFEAINKHLNGANTFDVVVEANEARDLFEPARLRSIDEFQDWLESLPEIGGTTSVVDFVKLIHRGFAPGGRAELAIPESRKLVGQMFLFGANDEMKRFIDSRYRLTKINVRTSLVNSGELAQLVDRIEARAAHDLAPMKTRVTGNRIVIQSLVDDLVRSQLSSLGIALGVIWLILAALFLSWRIGAIALIPNVVPITIFFGALGVSGIPLNFGTSLIAPMALGIAIDDTIHYFARFQEDAKRLANERLATVRTLRIVGRPITYTTLSIVLGFLVLTTSDLTTWQQLGGMAAFTLAVAWAVDFSLTPALCSGLRVATMWDTLRLDLGPDPQNSIPLFQGLTSWECRLAALIASIRNIPAGQPLLRSGQEGREMFLVIDGELEISVRHPDGEREVINICRRGDVIGEVGFFFKRRSADVDVLADARLLRLTQKNMEKLTRRYPRIAAKVLRNLSAIMAERLINTTDRLAKA